MVSEIEEIKKRYKERSDLNLSTVQSHFTAFIHKSRSEREFWGSMMLRQAFGGRLPEVRALEIGAGHGDNVHFLLRAGLCWQNIYLNELLEDRVEFLNSWFPKSRIFPGNLLDCSFDESFDLIYQSTVFSSILDFGLRNQIVEFVYNNLKSDGVFLWYDFCFDNPNNKHVKGIPLKEVRSLLEPRFQLVDSRKVTLAPPIGRRVGLAYGFFNTLFPFLRTHRVMLFKKRDGLL